MLSKYTVAGVCKSCGEQCFDVLQVYQPHERNPGEPKALGEPIKGVRITFSLYDNTLCNITFCYDCADNLTSEQYTEIWYRVMVGWLRELNEERPDWFINEFNNGISNEISRISWKELSGN